MNVLKKYRIHLKGISPLIMHSDKLVNPLEPKKKLISEISCIKKKTDEHYLAIAKIEWECSIYFEENLGIYMPSKNLRACIKAAAKKFKLGTSTKGILIDSPLGVPLIGYENQTPESLWKVCNKNGTPVHVFSESVVVSRSKIMRSRAIFPKWEVKFDLFLDIDIFTFKNLQMVLNAAGYEYGLCELRPEKASGTYGRFNVEDIKEL